MLEGSDLPPLKGEGREEGEKGRKWAPRVNPEFVYRGRGACTVSVLQYARTGRWLRTRKRDAKARESFSSCISLGRSRGTGKERGREGEREDLSRPFAYQDGYILRSGSWPASAVPRLPNWTALFLVPLAQESLHFGMEAENKRLE